MPSLNFQLFLRRHLVWMLWLVLALPLAQVAASWHVFSHVNSQSTSESDSRQVIHHAQCELCLGVAALGSGTPLVSVPLTPTTAAAHEAILSASSIVQWRLATPAYLSRAPPSFLC